ncbi:hypothetical protein Syun_020846 [Stephania yunnanensis]|uniref:Uncharacterized protein n=1 Tax=Stephania yunnanensis TaxID=152371 RepID=A0AAP0IEK7_9MAGN
MRSQARRVAVEPGPTNGGGGSRRRPGDARRRARVRAMAADDREATDVAGTGGRGVGGSRRHRGAAAATNSGAEGEDRAATTAPHGRSGRGRDDVAIVDERLSRRVAVDVDDGDDDDERTWLARIFASVQAKVKILAFQMKWVCKDEEESP